MEEEEAANGAAGARRWRRTPRMSATRALASEGTESIALAAGGASGSGGGAGLIMLGGNGEGDEDDERRR